VRARHFSTTVTATFREGLPDTYLLPLALVSGEPAARAIADTPAAVLARIAGARKGLIVDGALDDEVCTRLLELCDAESPLPSKFGTLRGVRAAGLVLPAERKWVPVRLRAGRYGGLAERSVRIETVPAIEPGPNPDFEIGQALTREAFPRTPALAGAVQYEGPGGAEPANARGDSDLCVEPGFRAGRSPSTNCSATSSASPRGSAAGTRR
jgi:hypothetical protein